MALRVSLPGRPLVLALASVALVCAGCDKARDLTPTERRVVVGAQARRFCPDVDADSSLQFRATVYGGDGSTAKGVEVTLVASSGRFEDSGTARFTAKTGDTGQLDATFVGRRPDSDRLTVTAMLPSGREDDIEVLMPPGARIDMIPTTLAPAVGDFIDISTSVSGVCNLRRVRLDISFNAAVVRYVDTVEGSLLNQNSPAGIPYPTDLQVNEVAPGRLLFEYARTDVPQTGARGSGLLLLPRFQAIAPGLAEIYITTRAVDVFGVLDGIPYRNESIVGPKEAASLGIVVQEPSPATRRAGR